MKKQKWLRSSLAMALTLSLILSGCGASNMESSATTESKPMENMNSSNHFYGDYDTVVEEEVEMEEAIESNPETGSGSKAEAALNDPLAGKNIKLIWTANLDMETLDYDTMLEDMTQSISDHGGYIESSYTEGGERLSGYTRSRYGHFTVRIPAANLDTFLNQMSGIGNVLSKSKSSENITLEYADNEARKATLELEEQKLMELLEQATILEDIITLESRLSDVHYQLDAYSSTLRKYDNLVDFSTVNISISEVQKMTETKAETLGERISAGFSDSIYELKVFGEDLIVFLIARSPILLIWAIVILLVVLIIRKLRKNRANKPKKERKLAPPSYNQPKAENSENKKE